LSLERPAVFGCLEGFESTCEGKTHLVGRDVFGVWRVGEKTQEEVSDVEGLSLLVSHVK
jgi:hypothetical protein